MRDSFTIFNTLPTELRLLIWEHSLTPRLIPLQCQIQCTLPKPSTFLYNSFLTPSTDRPHSRTREIPSSVVDIRLHFASASQIEPAPILQVCRESRHFAIKHGYRVWKLRNEFDHTRDVVWHAGLDIVSLGTPHRASTPRFYGELFRRQFPVEVKRVRAIALPIASWKEKIREKENVVACWAGYTGLRRMVVVVGKGGKTRMTEVEHDTCKIVIGVKAGLEMIAQVELGWKLPDIVLIGGEADILMAEDRELILDCSPCEANDGGCKVVPVHHEFSC